MTTNTSSPARNPFSHIDHPHKRAFLTAYRETANVRKAAEMAETSRTSVYRWRKEDPEFAEAFELAREDAADLEPPRVYRRPSGELLPLS